MSLPAGSRLGPYEILGPLGAGGMGEVYRARDTSLSRDVAIKVLPELFAAVVQTDFEDRYGQFSPDEKWIAYESTESGRWEVYVQPFPGPGAKVQVSVNGGAQARWGPDGKELFFIALDDRLMVVPIALPATAGSAEPGAPTPLFGTRVGGAVQSFSRQQYFVSPDGQRLLMNTILQTAPVSPITVIVNWAPQTAGRNP